MFHICINSSSELRRMLIDETRTISCFSAKRNDILSAWFSALAKQQGKHEAIFGLTK